MPLSDPEKRRAYDAQRQKTNRRLPRVVGETQPRRTQPVQPAHLPEASVVDSEGRGCGPPSRYS